MCTFFAEVSLCNDGLLCNISDFESTDSPKLREYAKIYTCEKCLILLFTKDYLLQSPEHNSVLEMKNTSHCKAVALKRPVKWKWYGIRPTHPGFPGYEGYS